MCDAVPLALSFLQRDLGSPAFRLGEAQGRWRLLQPIPESWPLAYLWVGAAAREGGPAGFDFRFDCDGYPTQPPSATLWDFDQDAALDGARWPKGSHDVHMAFFGRYDWLRERGGGVYHPFDRRALQGHDGNWMAPLRWKDGRTVVDYLNELSRLLQSADYRGI